MLVNCLHDNNSAWPGQSIVVAAPELKTSRSDVFAPE